MAELCDGDQVFWVMGQRDQRCWLCASRAGKTGGVSSKATCRHTTHVMPGIGHIEGQAIDLDSNVDVRRPEQPPVIQITITVERRRALVSIGTETGLSFPVEILDVGDDYNLLLERIQQELLAWDEDHS